MSKGANKMTEKLECETCKLSRNRNGGRDCGDTVGQCTEYDKWQSCYVTKADSEFEQLGTELGALLDKKRKAYGSGATRTTEVMNILYPEGVKPDQMHNMLLITRIVDKLCRIATNNDPFGESPFYDIAGYGLLGSAEVKKDGGKGI